jgi:hypothetical protein
MDGQTNWFNIINTMPVLSIKRSDAQVGDGHVQIRRKSTEVEKQTENIKVMVSSEENKEA